jgi:mannose-6-phosphate isomerase-like protein (cupin superfamily)
LVRIPAVKFSRDSDGVGRRRGDQFGAGIIYPRPPDYAATEEDAMTQVRRVVTGHDASGKAVFVSDGLAEPIRHPMNPEFLIHWLWGGDTAPRFPDAGAQPAKTTYFPPLGGFRFCLITMPPAGPPPPNLDVTAARREMEVVLPGVARYLEPDEPGMHTTATVDLEFVLAGEVGLELDEGQEVVLTAGDSVVQNGTRHRWHNRGSVPVVMLVISIGAHHARLSA